MIQVKAHKRKGRKVRAHSRNRKVLSHGRVKKENKAKKKGFELTRAIERSLETPADSLQEHIKAVRTLDRSVKERLNSGRDIRIPASSYRITSLISTPRTREGYVTSKSGNTRKYGKLRRGFTNIKKGVKVPSKKALMRK